jgi:hypothetical protein
MFIYLSLEGAARSFVLISIPSIVIQLTQHLHFSGWYFSAKPTSGEDGLLCPWVSYLVKVPGHWGMEMVEFSLHAKIMVRMETISIFRSGLSSCWSDLYICSTCLSFSGFRIVVVCYVCCCFDVAIKWTPRRNRVETPSHNTKLCITMGI